MEIVSALRSNKVEGGYLITDEQVNVIEEAFVIKDDRIQKLEEALRKEIIPGKDVTHQGAKGKGSVTVEIDGSSYKFRLRSFQFEGQKYTSEEAAENVELCKRVIEKTGETILRELV